MASSAMPFNTEYGGEYNLRSDSEIPFSPIKTEQRERGVVPRGPVKRNYRRWLLFGLLPLLVIAAIALGVYFGAVRRKSTSSTPSPAHSPPAAAPSDTPSEQPTAGAVIYGFNGTEVTTEAGVTFTYINRFGGYFVHDSGNPFNNDARPRSDTPPLNTSWDWSTDQVLG
jgi:hypothetical protein